MRKNSVNRELREILGGVCAPMGFRANGVRAGFTQDADKEDLALIVADGRCPTACVFSENFRQSGPACVSKRHLKYGVARAVIANSGVANIFLSDGEQLAEKVCRTLASRSDIDSNDTLIASTGIVGKTLTLATFEKAIPGLVRGLSATEEGSFKAARAIMTTDTEVKQLSFSFDLGDFPCKIGAIFKGNTRVGPHMATMLAFLTTDINISPEMLRKALSSTVRDTFNLLCIDGIASPNDTVCIMANGKAGNYKISCPDTEYTKFVYILREVLTEICRRIVRDGDSEGRTLLCKVTGARSKLISRTLARRIVASQGVRSLLLCGRSGTEALLYEINSVVEDIDFSRVRLSLSSETGEFVLYEDGGKLLLSSEKLGNIAAGRELVLSVELASGNYSSTAFGCIEPKVL